MSSTSDTHIDLDLDSDEPSPLALTAGELLARGLEANLQDTAEIAATTGSLAMRELARRVALGTDTLTSKQLLEIAETSAKLSGLLKRQEPKDDKGRFVFTIEFGGGSVVIDAAQPAEVVVDDPLASVKTALSAPANDPFADAPEF